MCIASEPTRKLCIKSQVDKDITNIKNDPKQSAQIKSAASVALQAIFNSKDNSSSEQMIQESQKSKLSQQEIQNYVKTLMTGINCKLYRSDGSSKVAQIQATSDLTEIVAKQPNGVIKSKYRLKLMDISFMKFNYSSSASGQHDWNQSVFVKIGSGMFSKKPVPERCFTINGKISEEGVVQINGEVPDAQIKNSFEVALKSVIHGLKTGEIKGK